jgi:hypothetical protein
MLPPLAVLALAVSTPSRRVAYFDSQGIIQRGPAPSSSPRVYFPVHKSLNLIAGAPGALKAAMLTEEQAAAFTDDSDAVLACVGRAAASSPLGQRAAELCGSVPGQASLWLLDVSHVDPPPELPGEWLAIRGGAGAYSVLEGLGDSDEAAALASVRGMALWHRSIPHCAKCGARTAAKRAGRQRQCTSEACGARFRPRIEPSILVLVTHNGKACLGRKAAWPAGRYSTLAGFVSSLHSLPDAHTACPFHGLSPSCVTLLHTLFQPRVLPRAQGCSTCLALFDARRIREQLALRPSCSQPAPFTASRLVVHALTQTIKISTLFRARGCVACRSILDSSRIRELLALCPACSQVPPKGSYKRTSRPNRPLLLMFTLYIHYQSLSFTQGAKLRGPQGDTRRSPELSFPLLSYTHVRRPVTTLRAPYPPSPSSTHSTGGSR